MSTLFQPFAIDEDVGVARSTVRAHAGADHARSGRWTCACPGCDRWRRWTTHGRFWIEGGDTGPTVGDAADGACLHFPAWGAARRMVRVAHDYVLRWGDIDLVISRETGDNAPAWCRGTGGAP